MDVTKVQGLTRNSASKNGIETRQISKIRGDADKKQPHQANDENNTSIEIEHNGQRTSLKYKKTALGLLHTSDAARSCGNNESFDDDVTSGKSEFIDRRSERPRLWPSR